MKDRIPVNPGRVLINPEDGSAPFYATMTRADNPTQEGTPLNKVSLLKDATAALFGLGADAVPDDVFQRVNERIIESGPKVGDIKVTARTDLGDDWVLCNGSKIPDGDEYYELGTLVDPNFSRFVRYAQYHSYVGEPVYANGVYAYAYVKETYKIYVAYSTDFVNWTHVEVATVNNSNLGIAGIAYSEYASKWCILFYYTASGSDYSIGSAYSQALDGSWSVNNAIITDTLSSFEQNSCIVTYLNNKVYLTVTYSYYSGKIFASSDCATWKAAETIYTTSYNLHHINGIVYKDGTYYFAGTFGNYNNNNISSCIFKATDIMDYNTYSTEWSFGKQYSRNSVSLKEANGYYFITMDKGESTDAVSLYVTKDFSSYPMQGVDIVCNGSPIRYINGFGVTYVDGRYILIISAFDEYVWSKTISSLTPDEGSSQLNFTDKGGKFSNLYTFNAIGPNKDIFVTYKTLNLFYLVKRYLPVISTNNAYTYMKAKE